MYSDGLNGYASGSSLEDPSGWVNTMVTYISYQKNKIDNGELADNDCLENYPEKVLSMPTKRSLALQEYLFGFTFSREHAIIFYDFECVLNEKQKLAFNANPEFFFEAISKKMISESLN